MPPRKVGIEIGSLDVCRAAADALHGLQNTVVGPRKQRTAG